jgi:N-acetylmuramoyl-L-alanine amidase
VNLIDKINKKQINPNVPAFQVGDTVRVDVKIIEGKRERIQAYEGVVTSRKGGSVSETFTVRKKNGNVGINRVLADCLDFKKITSIEKMVYQDPGGFSGSNSQLFYSSATTLEKNLAKRVINGEYFHPATNALWFYAPGKNVACKSTWYNQANSGKYKNHCFYIPNKGVCKELH